MACLRTDLARLRRDEPVDPARIHFRSSPSSETTSSRLAGPTGRLFVGTGARQPRSVVFDCQEVLKPLSAQPVHPAGRGCRLHP
jgi:hypothetical protein